MFFVSQIWFFSSFLDFLVNKLKNKLKIIKLLELTSPTNNAELGHNEVATSAKPNLTRFYRDLPT